MSNWQGGIRVNSYASGGFLPSAVRGTQNAGLIAGADWYATFANLAGVDPTDERAAAAGLPPIDGLDVWPLISGANATSPRTILAVGSDGVEANLPAGTRVQAVIRADGYKLMIGETGQNIWQGEYYPNASTSCAFKACRGILSCARKLGGFISPLPLANPPNPHLSSPPSLHPGTDTPYRCGVPSNGTVPAKGTGGCLFNILDDPTEHNQLDVTTPTNAAIVKELYAELLRIDATTFTPNRGRVSPLACTAAVQKYKGFWGPFVE